jgi:gamma-glutamyltranspeptidase/glutathione hydrolase
MGKQSKLKYAIAAGHHLTAKTAEEILIAGGNAFDACVAAYLVSFVAEPVMASAGAGGFANIHTPEEGNFVLDFFCQTPSNNVLSDRMYKEILVDFGESQETFFVGPASMAVPGAMAMIQHLAQHYCTIQLRELVGPAQTLAQQGVALTDFQAYDLQLLHDIVTDSEEGKALFATNGEVKKKGEVLHMPQYADFLESFAREKADWFYRGEPAQAVSDYAASSGGYISYQDFRNYKLLRRQAFRFLYQGHSISVPPLPSVGGGLLALFLKGHSQKSYALGSKEHLMSLRKAYQYSYPYGKSVSSLEKEIAKYFEGYTSTDSAELPTSGTSHFNICDGAGNAIALSTSIGEGCTYFIPGTDMQMNNMLGETALLPDGLDSWKKDSRLNSMMCPTLVFDQKHKVAMLIGTGGATRIPFSIGQTLINYYEHGMDLEQAVHYPRVFENENQIYLEKGYDYSDMTIDKDLKLWEDLDMVFGGTHSIDLKGKQAIGDQRREGIARMLIK